MFEKLTDRTLFVDRTPELPLLEDPPEPVRRDPMADRITLAEYRRQHPGLTVEAVDAAIARHGHPKPLGRTKTGEPIYSRAQLASWRAQVPADLRPFGFVVK